ncbi:folate-binding protein YgfZ [Loktanella sp. SALINAS62]|uniref:CAF17-like 4Fe-4S cluster assembly/insertion protein YgfZ n=1 Tax=Loktanella sp. SALINAS62 TaxID=2706124 RepID=UPI001B8AF113|nr:folate-binding protein YgfZ [Loktanella sp. SALINAS62]MBS1300792.1 folate-binding protein YgfZ [Loktanella sp. SALINAS62]
MNERTVLSLTGKDRVEFLQGLVTNDVSRATGGIVYTALLTPQGKYLADFFVLGEPDRLLIDVASSHAAGLGQRLNMYRLRADVQIETTDLVVSRGTGDAPDGALPDPRHAALGWRHYGDTNISDATDWDAVRVAHLVPASGIELTPETYILEAGFERLHGVDFRKGCFVGQEIVARMKHKTTLRKGLVQVAVDGPAQSGDEIVNDGRPAGVLHTVAGDMAIAYLRFDRTDNMTAGDATLTLVGQPQSG